MEGKAVTTENAENAETLIWQPPHGQQTTALRAAGLTVVDLREAGFRWGRSQAWEADPTPAARDIIAKLTSPRIQSTEDREGAPVMRGAKDIPSQLRIFDGEQPKAEEKPAPEPAAPDPLTQRYDVGRLSVLSGKAKALADRLDRDAEAGERSREMNTPKRYAQAMHARLEAAVNRRAAQLLRAWADEPGKLPDWKPNKADAQLAVRRELENVPNGYHSYHVENSKPYKTDDATALALRAAYGIGDAQETQAAKIERLEAAVKFDPIPGFFPTPPALIERIMELADIHDGHRVLEPSAGNGNLADAARAAGGAVVCCEISSRLRDILTAKGHTIIASDFNDMDPRPVQDRIVANPPFEKGQDRDHIRRMFDHLAPGGRLVSVCSTGPFHRQHKADVEFREWLDREGAVVEEVGAGAFAGSDAFRQTGVAVNLVLIDREA